MDSVKEKRIIGMQLGVSSLFQQKPFVIHDSEYFCLKYKIIQEING